MIGRNVMVAVVGLVSIGATWQRASAADRWVAEFHLGGAWNLPLPLVIRQSGFEDLDFYARWRTDALKPPLYYVARLATLGDQRGWALDLTHHKIHLNTPPAEVRSFSVSHGYNLLTLRRLIRDEKWRYGVGAGVVIAHPESEVRGQSLDEHDGLFGAGYYVSGPTLDVLVSWLPATGGGLYPLVESRITVSYARVPVSQGHARVPNVALHLTVGAGWGTSR